MFGDTLAICSQWAVQTWVAKTAIVGVASVGGSTVQTATHHAPSRQRGSQQKHRSLRRRRDTRVYVFVTMHFRSFALSRRRGCHGGRCAWVSCAMRCEDGRPTLLETDFVGLPRPRTRLTAAEQRNTETSMFPTGPVHGGVFEATFYARLSTRDLVGTWQRNVEAGVNSEMPASQEDKNGIPRQT